MTAGDSRNRRECFLPLAFDPKDLKTGIYTGLQVSHEPGQWAVWAGVVLMAIGLTFVLYVIHVRFWVFPVSTARQLHVVDRRNGKSQP